MRYCNQCHRITTGEPMFCNFCGSSYDVRLCPSRHINPRNADVCSQCGSRDFSRPAPRVAFWVVPLLWLLSLFPGVLLLIVSVLFLVGFVNVLATNQQFLFQFMLLGLLLGILWYCYMQIPHFLKDLFRTIWRKSKKDRPGH